MDQERIGIEVIVVVIVWFALVLVAFFYVGAVVGVLVVAGVAFVWWSRE